MLICGRIVLNGSRQKGTWFYAINTVGPCMSVFREAAELDSGMQLWLAVLV